MSQFFLFVMIVVLIGIAVVVVNYFQNKSFKKYVDETFPRVPIETKRVVSQIQDLSVEGKKKIDEILK